MVPGQRCAESEGDLRLCPALGPADPNTSMQAWCPNPWRAFTSLIFRRAPSSEVDGSHSVAWLPRGELGLRSYKGTNVYETISPLTFFFCSIECKMSNTKELTGIAVMATTG